MYSLGSFVLRGITASIGIITLRFLTPTEYGLLGLLNNFIALAPIFLNLGLRQAFGVDFFHKNQEGRLHMLKEIIGLYLLLATPIMVIGIFIRSWLNVTVFAGQATPFMIFIVLSTSFIHFFSELYFQVLRYRCKALQLTILQFIMAATTILITVVLVYYMHLKIVGIMIANFSAMLVSIGYAGFQYIKKIKQQWLIVPSVQQSIYYIKLGLPFIPNIIFFWILSSGNRWFLAWHGDMHAVGIYCLADMVVQLFQLLILYPLSASYVPYVFQQFAANKNDIINLDAKNYRAMYASMALAAILISIGCIIIYPILYRFLPNTYYEAIKYIWFMLFSQIFLMGSYFATCYLQFYKKNYALVSFTILAALVSCSINFLLIPYLHIWACLLASCIAYIVYFIAIIVWTKRVKYAVKKSFL